MLHFRYRYGLGLLAVLVVLWFAGHGLILAQDGSTATPNINWVSMPNGVNVRSGPGFKYDVNGVLPVGAWVQPLARNLDGEWILVTYLDTQGWIQVDGVSWRLNTAALPVIDDPAPTSIPRPLYYNTPSGPTYTPNANWVHTAADGAYVRSGPGQGYVPIGIVSAGDVVDPVAHDEALDWVMIRYGDGYGWIRYDLVTWIDDIQPLPVIDAANLTPSFTPVPIRPTSTRTSIPTVTVTASLTATPQATATDTASPEPSPTFTPSSTFTAVPTAADTPSLTPTATETATLTATATPSLTPTEIPSSTPAPLPAVTDTPSPVPTATPTVAPTDTVTYTATYTATAVPTETAAPTLTATTTPSQEPTLTPQPTAAELLPAAATWTPLPSATHTASPVPTDTATPIPPTETPSPVPTVTETASPIPTTTLANTATYTVTAVPPTETAAPTLTATASSTPPEPPAATPTVTASPQITATPLAVAIGEQNNGTGSGNNTPPGPAGTVIEAPPSSTAKSGGLPILPLLLGGGLGLGTLLYISIYVAQAANVARYQEGFMLSICPVCASGNLYVEERRYRMLGIPRVRRVVRCDTCRSVLRQVGRQRWRYAVDGAENPELYDRFNGRELTEQQLIQIAPEYQDGPPEFIEEDDTSRN